MKKKLNPKEKQRRTRDKYYQRNYGITLEQYEAQLAKQNFCCALCGKHESLFKKKLAQDHNHKSGRNRGILCPYCNRRRVGQLTLEWAKRIYEYLLKYDLPEQT